MYKMELNGRKIITLLSIVIILLIRASDGLHFSKSAITYARFPKWNACVNASISFEFKTRFADSLLLYTDDNGKFDYVEIVLKSGSVRLRINIVDGRDGSEEITLGQRLGDNRWHRVELRRNRMESTLYVDGDHASKVAFGSDFNFGELSRNNFVYLGGLPETYHNPEQNRLAKLSLSSAYFEPRFEGEIRNVFYGNCSCELTRGELIQGESVSREPAEACEKENTCDKDCLCISRDDAAGCQCKGLDCETDTSTYYRLPMDEVLNDNLVNPSGLDATVTGNPQIVPGVVGRALKIDEKFQKIKVSGPGHRTECFGDLELCPQGYTLALWVRFDEPGQGNGVYISNGAQSPNSHGVAMLYQIGRLEWIFKTKGTGHEWRATASNVLPRHWYHVTVTWQADDGLALYINGNKVAHSGNPKRVAPTTNTAYNDFIIGQSNDGTGSGALGTMTIDEFQFWSMRLEDETLREKGPIYTHHISMDQFEHGQLIVPYLEPRIYGAVRQVPGKIGQAVSLTGGREYIDLGLFTRSCLGNTSLCMYGFTIAFWVNFKEFKDNEYYMASGHEGFTIYSYQKNLYVTVQESDRKWLTSTYGLQTGTWYFLEISWSRTSGLRLYVNRMLTSSQSTSVYQPITSSLLGRFYVGRANTYMYYQRYANAMFDEIEMYNAERERLLSIDFILRGRPEKTHLGFDSIVSNKIDHPSIVIQTTGSPSLVPGKIANALRLNGTAQTAEFDHGDNCLGNLDYCLHGVLLALWMRPEKFEEGMFYLSSGINGITLSRITGKLRVIVTTTTQRWQVLVPDVTSIDWYYIEISWDPDMGLKLFANNKLLAQDFYPEENKNSYLATQLVYDKFIFGNANGVKSGSLYGAATYDEMEFWLASREYLLAFQYIQRGQPMHYRINMDIILDQGKRLAHPVLPIKLHGYPSLVPGVLEEAVQLNALSQNAQYIDVGDQTDKCLGNLQKCRFGITISFWIKIDNYYNNMFIVSTGLEGIRIYFQTGNIYFRIDNRDKTWRATIPKVSERDWHLLELSWHPEYGMNIYVDKELSAHAQYRTITPLYQHGTKEFYIGAPNSADSFGQKFSYGNLAVDEFEVWYSRREDLLAFGYILRDHVEYESFSMETVTSSGNVIFHERYNVTLEQGARLVPGKIGNAVSLEGKGQYVDLGEHMDKCMANLDLCDLGLTIALWLKPNKLQNNTYYLSGPMYSIYYANGKLKADFMSRGKVWNVETTMFAGDAWNHVMLSWDREDGLEMFVGNREVDDDRQPTEMMLGEQAIGGGNLYIGKYAGSTSPASTTNMLADEVEYWYSNIDRLVAQGLYGFPVHEVIPIGQLARGGVLRLSSRNISIENGGKIAEGQHSKAIQLNGKSQYINLGKDLVCGGDLDQCHQGFTLRFSTKPDKLVDNTYFLDSYPLSIFYSKANNYGRLYATVRTSTKTWTVASPGFKAGEWQLVDVSWHPEIGLTMHVNDAEVGSHKTHGTDKEPDFDIDHRTFFGRSLDGWQGDRYAATTLENFEVWNVRRDVLLSNGVKFVTPKPEATKPPLVTSTSVPSDDSGSRVFVTTFPNGTTQVIGSGLIPSSTNSIIRFWGESFIQYDFRDLPSEMLSSASNESLALQFLTSDTEGLIWLLTGDNGKKIYLSTQNGALLFVIQDGSRTPQQVVLRDPKGGVFNDRKWYTFKVEKFGRNLKFSVNGQYITEVTSNSDIEFVTKGDFFLGGSDKTQINTGNLVRSNLDGGVTDVEVRKYTSALREIIISFLQYVESAKKNGTIDIIDRTKIGDYDWYPVATTPAPARPTPVTFTSASSVFYLRDPLDMSRDRSSISFRFRTLEPRGLLAIARGRNQGPKFIAIEIFDGILSFLYDPGSFPSRKEFSTRRVDDGEWHEVMLTVENNRMTISLDGRKIPTTLSREEVSGLQFYRLYVGGYDNMRNVPWLVYSRIGYRGCLEALKINGIGVDLHSRFRDNNIQGVQIGCRSMARYCQTQPCNRGACKDLMDAYECVCPNTYFTGQDCDKPAFTLSMDGTKSADYQFINREVTHTNDLSVRFLTPLADTLLFTTEADNTDDFIRAELFQGRVKLTMRVDGKTKTFLTGNNLNDYNWHTLYIRRRADDVEVWVDDDPRMAGVIGGQGYQLMIDRIKFGSLGSTSSLSSNNYIGLMQNFIYDKTDVFTEMKRTTSKLHWIIGVSPTNTPIPVYKPVTVTSSNTHFRLPSMGTGRTMKILFKFRTREANGLILYSKGNGNDAIAVEMSNGQIRLAYNLGGRNMFTVVPTVSSLNDNNWHTVQIMLNENGQFSVRVDGENLDVSASDGDGRLDLTGNLLYIAGLPDSMFRQPVVRNFIESRKGFRGCLASIDLNGAVPDLLARNYADDKSLIVNGCTDLIVDCKPDVCGTGMCVPRVEDYYCDCNMTGYIGTPCNQEPVGYYFGKNNGNGIVVYTFPPEQMFSSPLDQIAFGFKSYQENGVLYRVESALDGKEFIEIRLENGFLIAESNTGGGIVSVSERSQKFNDGAYHTVRYIRTGSNSTLQVNQLPTKLALNTGLVSLLDKVHTVIIGGRTNEKGQPINNFNGIIGGAYYNKHRWLDLLYRGQQLHGRLVSIRGDVVLSKPFILIKGGTPTVKPTAGPPPIVIPPDSVVPGDIGGSGISENPPSGEGGGGGGSVLGIGDAGGIHTFPGAGIYVPGAPNVAAASSLLGPGPPPVAIGARAGAVVGTVLGTLAFMTSLMWALYKLKPGVPQCLSPGAGAAGGGGGMSISAPRTTSNLAAVQAASAGGAGGGAGAGGAGAGKVTVVNGAASGGGGGAGGGSSTYTSYFQSTSTSVGGGGAGAGGAGAGGADQYDSATLRATGTFSNKGTSIGSPGAGRANMGSSSSYGANYQSNTANYQSNTLQSMQSYGSGQASPGGVGGGMSSASYSDRQYLASGDGIPDYDLPVSGTLQSGHSYSSSTLNTHYNYQINNANRQSHQHTSVLNILLTGNRPASPVQVRHEVYTPALAAAADQTYVDRSEDLVVEQPRSVVFIRPSVVVEDTGVGTTSSVTLKTGESAQASYNAYYDSSAYSSIQDVTSSTSHLFSSGVHVDRDLSASSADMFSGNRKASLQIFPKSSKVGYQRLENSSSETNVNIMTGSASSKKGRQLDASHDTMYESSVTVTSSVYSGSIDTNLSNLEEENKVADIPESLDSLMASFADFKTDFSAELGDFSVATPSETIYAQVDKSKKSKSIDDKSEMSIELKDLGFPDTRSSEKIKETDTKSVSSTSSSSSSDSSSSDSSRENADKVIALMEGLSQATQGNQTDRSETVVEFKRPSFAKQTSKTSSTSINLSVTGDVTNTSSFESHHTSEFSSSSSSSTLKTSRMTSIGETSTTMAIGLEGATGETTTPGDGRNLDAELDANMSALLTGIDVDTSKWTQLKDASGFDVGALQGDDWEVQNLKTVTINRQGQYVMSGGAVTPGAAADEVRVDCCLITSDGCHVVTGSSLGPPQVWDMQSGELKNIMKGDTIGSTGLHLVCGDRLMVGAVHADMEINEYSGRKGVFNHHLQIWDFVSGKPLSMAEGEYCSVLCPMSDNDKVMFGRTDKFGDATSIIAWDLMGNQMIKEMRYDAPVGNNDYISYLTLSKNDRYVVAGFTNSFDNYAEFMTFDMTLTSYNISEPAMLKLDANPDCTAILPKDEAVTGLRNGDLVIWSIRTAQPSRQLLGGGGAHAHTREVKCMSLSKDGKYLVSGSADGTLKVWDMHTERPVHTLNGHTDEVWCSGISDDNEIVVSGSSDGTIRLWRMKNGTEMCVFNCGVDIFFVTMSRDKGTIVALGDKFGARKLIMLQVVRTKIKKIVSS